MLPVPTPWWGGYLVRRAMGTLISAAPLLLAPVVIRRRIRRNDTPSPLPLAVKDGSNVQEAHDGSNDGVRDDVAALSAGQLQSKTTVDHTQYDSDAADANVGVGDCCAAAVLLEVAMVQHASNRLREEDDEQDNADDRVGVGQVSAIDGDPESHAKGYDVDEEADDLESGVDPDKASEAGYSDKDAANGEEDDKC